MINAVQGGIGHVDFLVLFALPCLLLLGSDCIAHFPHQFFGGTGSPYCGIDYLAMSLKGIILKRVLNRPLLSKFAIKHVGLRPAHTRMMKPVSSSNGFL